jgi:ECF transporter, substrate-specific component
MAVTTAAQALPSATDPTLPWLGARAVSIQAALLVTSAVALPAAAHALGLPVRWLLPMHWPVILAGLVYGWRSGALLGAAAPALSYALSGWPMPAVLPAMTAELALYGGVAGALTERARWSRVAATAIALVAGRGLFLPIALATGWSGPDLPAYLKTALAPGLVAAILQCALLPPLARRWVGRAR